MLPWAPLVLLSSALLLGACEGQRVPAATPTPPPPPAVTQAPGGMLRYDPPITDVAMVELQPDGSYKRVCKTPGPAVRAMMNGLQRSRRASR
jgi:hypothetical protein